jgi:hypothetical protein
MILYQHSPQRAEEKSRVWYDTRTVLHRQPPLQIVIEDPHTTVPRVNVLMCAVRRVYQELRTRIFSPISRAAVLYSR